MTKYVKADNYQLANELIWFARGWGNQSSIEEILRKISRGKEFIICYGHSTHALRYKVACAEEDGYVKIMPERWNGLSHSRLLVQKDD